MKHEEYRKRSLKISNSKCYGLSKYIDKIVLITFFKSSIRMFENAIQIRLIDVVCNPIALNSNHSMNGSRNLEQQVFEASVNGKKIN